MRKSWLKHDFGVKWQTDSYIRAHIWLNLLNSSGGKPINSIFHLSDVGWLCWCFMALRHFLGHFGQVSWPSHTLPEQASWAVYQYLEPSLSPVTDNCPSWITGRVENGHILFSWPNLNLTDVIWFCLLSSSSLFYCHLLTHLLQMTVRLQQCLLVQSGDIGLIIGFTHFSLVKYVTNTHVFKQGILRLLSEPGQN